VDESIRLWTSVGSAGSLNGADLAKVSLHQSVIQLGVDVPLPQAMEIAAPAPGVAAAHLGPNFPTIQAVVRYNVTPVDGLFPDFQFSYGLQIRYRGQITAKLVQVDLETGAETQLIPAGNDHFQPTLYFEVKTLYAEGWSVPLDFVEKAYYVEATLTAPAMVIGHPAAISIVKLLATPPLR
jgi:hypothetical protein